MFPVVGTESSEVELEVSREGLPAYEAEVRAEGLPNYRVFDRPAGSPPQGSEVIEPCACPEAPSSPLACALLAETARPAQRPVAWWRGFAAARPRLSPPAPIAPASSFAASRGPHGDRCFQPAPRGCSACPSPISIA